jgi:hypothetical protein
VNSRYRTCFSWAYFYTYLFYILYFMRNYWGEDLANFRANFFHFDNKAPAEEPRLPCPASSMRQRREFFGKHLRRGHRACGAIRAGFGSVLPLATLPK